MNDYVRSNERRPQEREALLNPAFMAVLLAHAAAGHEQRTDQAMPFALAFLAAPLALHAPTRAALPRKVTVRFGAWINSNPLLRAGFPARASTVAPAVRTGLRQGLRVGVLELSDGRVFGRVPRRRASVELSLEVEEIFTRARFVGGWLGLAGSPAASYALLRVRP